MKTVGIICEYNPLHLGHKKQMDHIRREFGADTAIVCAMSGNFVQRGSPAIIDKSARAAAAVACGADLVLELPIPGALSSAEGFAAAGVRTLAPLCDALCFGAETAQPDTLLSAAQGLLHPDFPPLLRQALDTGKSFPAQQHSGCRILQGHFDPGAVYGTLPHLPGRQLPRCNCGCGQSLRHRPAKPYAERPQLERLCSV